MKLPQLSLLLLILIVVSECKPSIKCLAYFLQLQTFYNTNKGLFFEQIAPYMLFSGKQLDDMGFPTMCVDKDYKYTTVKIDAIMSDEHASHQNFVYSFYYGFCFSNLCSLSDMNEDGKFIIEKIFQNDAVNINSITFYDVDLQANLSYISLIAIILIIIWLFISMISPFSKWFEQCLSAVQDANSNKQITIPLQQKNKQQTQQTQIYQQPIQNKFLKLISIGRKWNQLWKSEQSTKIIQFSQFKIISVPFIIYGYYFYLCNQGSFNIFAFNTEIYTALYSNFSTFTYYIPDLFYFISGYLFTKKILTAGEFANNKYLFLGKCLLVKFIRLYPIYIISLIIYSVITPSLHGGPMWNIHKQNIEICQSVWWRNILMIDNFFQEGCFEFSWWIQAEIQFSLFTALTFTLLFFKKSFGSILFYISFVASWILLFCLSERLPIDLQTTVSIQSEHYFKSFHSHLPFYLTGVLLALTFKKESSRRILIKYYFKNTIILLLAIFSALATIILVFLRPVVFEYEMLGLQLSLCRMGILFSFIIYCLPGFIKQKIHRTVLHKIAELTYPIILVSGIIVSASYWGLQSFPYTSAQNIMYNLFPNLFLSFFVGLILHLLFNFRVKEIKNTQII